MSKKPKRTAKGQFAKGSSGNPGGRPKGRTDLLRIMSTTVTPKRWKIVCDRALSDAEGGDAVARKWIMDHLAGKPLERAKIEITRTPVTLGDWQRQVDERREEAEEC